MGFAELGRYLVVSGLILAGAGLLLIIASRITGFSGLPGDFSFRRGGVTIYFPLATMLILSLLLTLILNFFLRR